VQVEFIYTGILTGFGLSAPGGVTLIGNSGPVPLDGWYEQTLTWRIWPQPPEEVIYLAFNGSGGTVDKIEIATVCKPTIPAPAALLLTGFGTGLVGLLRRRRTI
jgi:hypothetical protein